MIEKEIHHAVEESLTISSKKKINVIHSDSDDDFAEKENKKHEEKLPGSGNTLLDRVKNSERSKIKKEPSQEYVPSSRESEVSSQETACLEEEEEEDPSSGSDSDYSGESDYETKKVKGVVVPKKHTVSPKLKNVPPKKVIINLTKVSKQTTPNIPSTTRPVEQQVTKVPTLSTPVRPPPKQRSTPTNKAHTSVHSTINIPTPISSSPTQSPLNIKLGLSKRAKFKPLHAKVQNKLP